MDTNPSGGQLLSSLSQHGMTQSEERISAGDAMAAASGLSQVKLEGDPRSPQQLPDQMTDRGQMQTAQQIAQLWCLSYETNPYDKIHPQINSVPTPQMTASREEPPLYVNAKQYHRIIKRRSVRQKQEEMRPFKARKPYLYESRHNHAMRRPRGPNGRYLTADEIAATETKATKDGDDTSHGPRIKSTQYSDSREEKRKTKRGTSVKKAKATRKGRHGRPAIE